MRFAFALLAAGVSVLAASCSHDDTAAPAPFVARFDLPADGSAPDLLEVPFPSDLLRAADGTIRFASGGYDDPHGIDRLVPNPPMAAFLAQAFAITRGFGVYAGAFFALDGGAADGAKLPAGAPGDCTRADAPVVVFDLTANAPLECQAAWSDDGVYGEDRTTPVLAVRTARGVVIPEEHRVAVLLTSRVTSKAGAPLSASPAFAAIRDGARDDPRAKLYGDAIDAASRAMGIDAKTIAAAAVYTTGKVTGELRAARAAAAATPLPSLAWGASDVAPVAPARFAGAAMPGWTATLDEYLGAPRALPSGDPDPDFCGTNTGVAHDAIGAIGVASIEAPNLLVDHGSYDDPAHGTFFHDAGGQVAVNPDKPTARVWITFVVPKAPPPSAAGYPVVVYQHGLGGQRSDALALANTFAARGWATAAIDAVLQGTRSPEQAARGDAKSNVKRSSATYDGPDGFPDTDATGANASPGDLFGGFYRPAAMRDQLRQAVIDHATLARLLASSPALDGLAIGGVAPKLDGTKLAYVGTSLGGILGAMVAAIEPAHRAYVLNVGGGGIFVDLAPNAPKIGGLLSTAANVFFGLRNVEVTPLHPLVNLLQHVQDGGDPMAFARSIVESPVEGPPRNVLTIEVVHDELMANQATEALARAMGAPVIAPHAPLVATLAEATDGAHDVPRAGSTAVLVQTSPGEHAQDLYCKRGERDYAADGPVFGDPTRPPFVKLATPVTFDNDYLALQALVTSFVGDAFAGNVPVVRWTTPPAPVHD